MKRYDDLIMDLLKGETPKEKYDNLIELLRSLDEIKERFGEMTDRANWHEYIANQTKH